MAAELFHADGQTHRHFESHSYFPEIMPTRLQRVSALRLYFCCLLKGDVYKQVNQICSHISELTVQKYGT